MFEWFKSKCTHEEAYITLHKRITDVELRLDSMEAFQDNIRNMARKIQTRKTTESEDINNTTAGLIRGRIQK